MKLRDAIDEAIAIGGGGATAAVAAATEEELDDSMNTEVYVMGLPWETSDEELLAHMSQAGDIVKADVLKTKIGRSLGRGVVEFANPEAAVHAIHTLDNSEIRGRSITVRYNRQKRPPGGATARKAAAGQDIEAMEKVPDEHKVFVSNLSWNTTASDLTKFFESVGLVAESDVLTKRSGRSLGLGHVQFVDSRSVNQAIVQLNGQELMGRLLHVRAYYQK